MNNEKPHMTENQRKIAEVLSKVRENLIAYKKKMNSDLVIMKDGKIVRIKPENL